MGESLKEVLARIQAQSNIQKPVPKAPERKLTEAEEEEADYEDMMKEPVEPQVKQPLPKTPTPESKVDSENPDLERQAMEIELLQNDGRFRANLLFQLQNINDSLSVIGQVLIDLSGNAKAH